MPHPCDHGTTSSTVSHGFTTRLRVAGFVAWKSLLVFAASVEFAHAAFVAWDQLASIGFLW